MAPERPVLEAALDAGLNLPHTCKGGNCGACRVRLLEGEVRYPNGRPLGLSDAEVADGFILLCQARAISDLRIEAFERSAPGESARSTRCSWKRSSKRLCLSSSFRDGSSSRCWLEASSRRMMSWARSCACPPLKILISNPVNTST